MIAARQIFLGRGAGGGGWTNPYVTNGLVSMFDGQWNAGGGIHNTGVLFSWADLASGHPASITNGALVGDNYLDFSANAASAIPSSEYDALPGRAGPFTLELVMALPSAFPLALFAAAQKDADRNVFCNIRVSSGNIQISLARNRVNVTWVALWTTAPSGAQHIVITNNGSGGLSLSLNGESKTVPSSVTGFSSVVRYFGNAATPSENQGVAKYHCARLYSRVLTAAEIAANCAIDKARFNLP